MPEKDLHLIDYLPAIFRETSFLEEFLRPFEKVIGDFQTRLDHLHTCFNPTTTEPEFLPWLASWIALLLDDQWPEEKKRLLISRAMGLYRGRGTVESLKEYLEIYTGEAKDDITIRECLWPAGMQIGVASRIGGLIPPDVRFESIAAEREPPTSYDYYVVRETEPGTETVRQYYYRTDLVRKVDVNVQQASVKMYYVHPDPEPFTVHPNASVTRRDGLADTRYRLTGTPSGGGEPISADYVGDSVLIREEGEVPYRFIVDLKVSPNRVHEVQVNKIQAILDLEKPAHTLYYLRLILARTERQLKPMQIGESSSLGVDNYIAERNCYE